jgi:hypothetical protein
MAHVPGRTRRLLKEVVLDEDAIFASIGEISYRPAIAAPALIGR